MSDREVHAANLELNFFDSADFESETANTKENANIIARNTLRIIFMGWRTNWKDIFSTKFLNALLFKRDNELLLSMRKAFQTGFIYVHSQLENRVLTPKQHNQAQLFINNCLTLLPYADISHHDFFHIPQFIDNQWVQVKYKVVPIELTQTKGFKKLFINDEDRVFAYGLEPDNNNKAEPIFIFMGTTYPAGRGFITQINTDMEAFETAGKKLYRSGHKKITAWLDKQKNKARVCGVSLGGSLSLLLAIHQGDRLSRVDALNPAGIYEPWRKSRFDNWDALTKKPTVFVQKQGNDFVSKFGIWKKEWTILHVCPAKHRQGPNSYVDHAINYAGFADTAFFIIDTQADNKIRRTRNLVLYTLTRSLVYYLTLIPYRYVIRPIILYALNHKLQLSLTGFFIGFFCLLPILAIPLVITSVMLNAIISAVIIGFLIHKTIELFVAKFIGKNESHTAQVLQWLNKQSILNKTLFLLSLGCMIVIPIVSLAVALGVFFFLASIPLVNSLFHTVVKIVRIILGLEEVPDLDFQNLLPLNNELLNTDQKGTISMLSLKKPSDQDLQNLKPLNIELLTNQNKTEKIPDKDLGSDQIKHPTNKNKCLTSVSAEGKNNSCFFNKSTQKQGITQDLDSTLTVNDVLQNPRPNKNA